MADWPHAPVHRLAEKGTYMVTCGTYHKQHILTTPGHLYCVQDLLFETAVKYGWSLQAWSIFSNHFHLIASCEKNPEDLTLWMSELHTRSAIALNTIDQCHGRKIWYQFFDTQITFPKSYYARLHYVHRNPVKHGLVEQARRYPWCSAAWFEREAPARFVKTVYSFKIDKVNVYDSFD